MVETQVLTQAVKGGEFLIKNAKAEQIFTPEDFNEEQLMMGDMASEFIEQHITPNIQKIEKLDLKLIRLLLSEAGELGLLGTSTPPEYEGIGLDLTTNMLIDERFTKAGSFALTRGAHIGIGMLPILYFGTEAQKAKYLPDLATGKTVAAYCLTEPGSGSDALAAKSRAVLSEDGKHYILNGQKMWITNGGLADVFTVFAKIDGTLFTGFIVEKQWDGVTTGGEEDKLGIKGSSTRQVFFENVKVPVENVLGQIGKGHIIAFNILNIGRFKLGISGVGASKDVINNAVRYANERIQFKQPISAFGAIQHKLAQQVIRTYAMESTQYRLTRDIQSIEENLMAAGKTKAEALLGAAKEYAIECALVKVQGSECLDFVVDEGVQIYGGMGYSEEAPMARAYRDSRINRIFEGTNEINRMLMVNQLVKKVFKGELDLMTPALALQQELMSGNGVHFNGNGDFFAKERHYLKNMKKAFLLVAGATVQNLKQQLKGEQEILMYLSDIISAIYLAESTLLRVEKRYQIDGASAVTLQMDIMRVFFDDTLEQIHLNGKRAITAWAEGNMKKMLLAGLRKLMRYDGINTKAARRRIAEVLIAANEYCF